MKKISFISVLIVACISLTACSGAPSTTENKQSSTNNKMTTEQQPTNAGTASAPNNSNNNINAPRITLDQAKEIALKDANLTSDQVVFESVDSDNDDDDEKGLETYDIDFSYNNVEYSYEIDANTGNILSSSQD